MNSLIERFKVFFAPLSPAQRTLFGGLCVAIVIFMSTLFYWALRPSYTLLFGSLKNEVANDIVQNLKERGAEYKLENGGQAIYVHEDKVDELRVELAPIGAPQSDMKGYELFDSNSLGMTDYMQQLNNRRALEGELSRSINNLQQVESSRLHLVLPERSPFKQTSVEASASVIVSLKPGASLQKKQIQGITSLIAGSVEGLNAEGVTIIDQTGKRLTNGEEEQGKFASDGDWLKTEQKTESYLTERGQSMLDRVLGPGNSIIRVSVEQNFDSVVRESNKIDPESRTLISEQQNEETHSVEGSELIPIDEFTPIGERGETAVTSTNQDEVTSRTRNYEVSETKEIFKKAQGEISYLSASVLLNYKKTLQENEEGERKWESKPYSEDEIEGFKEVLSSALGVQPERGDQIIIRQVEFWNPTGLSPEMDAVGTPWPWDKIFRWGLILITLIAVIILLNNLIKQIRIGNQGLVFGSELKDKQSMFLNAQEEESYEGLSAEDLQELVSDNEDDELPALEEKKYDLDEIVDMVELKPTKAARVVRAMLIIDDE